MVGKASGRQSVFRQILAMGLGLVLVLSAAFTITNLQMRLIQKKNTLNVNEQNMEQMEGKLDEYSGLMTQIATVTAYSPTIYTYFFQNSVERVISTDDVNTVFSNTILLEKNISGIYVFDKNMELIANMGNGTQERENMELIHIWKEQQEYSNVFYFNNSSVPYYAIYFPVFDLNSQVYAQQIGMCVFIMETDKLGEILQGEQATGHTQVYLLDGEDKVLAVRGGEDIERLEAEQMQDSADYHVTCCDLPVGGWKLVSRIPGKELYGGNDRNIGFYLGMYFLAMGLLLCMILFCYRRLVLPVREMDSFVRKVMDEPKARMRIRRQDEIGTVEMGINQMLDSIEEKNVQIREAREKTYQMESAEKQLQILAYRNQINPHFLYNTLDCIRGMALYHEEEEIAEITLALSKLFRFAVKGGNVVKVEEEVSHIREYARIIDYRFRGRIKVHVEMEAEVRTKPVIKFLLQPLIENAVFHGLEQKLEGGEVWASIHMEEEHKIQCSVEDNGCGIEAEKLEQLKGELQNSEGQSQKGIGMANIYQRLRLFYGEGASFSIESVQGQGTKVVIVIPDQVEEGTITYV